MPFYSYLGLTLVEEPGPILGPDFELRPEAPYSHSYPVDGWYWFNSLQEAEAAMPMPAELVPKFVSMRQARLALLEAGKLATVEALLQTLPSPQREVAEVDWTASSVVDRQSGLVLLFGGALGYTPHDLDRLFVRAKQL